MRACLFTLDHISARCVLRHEDETFQSSARCVCSQRPRSVPSRGHCKFFSAEFFRHRNRYSHTPRFETLSGILRLILYVKLAQSQFLPKSRRMKQRRPALAQRDDVFVALDRQYLTIAPEVRPPARQRFFCQIALSLIEIVPDQKRFATLAAKIVQALCLVLQTTCRAFKMCN